MPEGGHDTQERGRHRVEDILGREEAAWLQASWWAAAWATP